MLEVKGSAMCVCLAWEDIALRLTACSRTLLPSLGLPFRDPKALQSVQYYLFLSFFFVMDF